MGHTLTDWQAKAAAVVRDAGNARASCEVGVSAAPRR